MSVSKTQVLDELRRIKGPALEGNIVELGLVSEILIRDGRVYFSITVPPDQASELEPLRQAAEKVVGEIAGVTGVTAVLTAEAPKGGAGHHNGAGHRNGGAKSGQAPEHSRVAEARARGATGDGAGPRPQQARGASAVPGVKHLVAIASGKGGVGKSTTAVNLALGFQALGLKAGILDADIYGPSQPKLLGLSGNPQTSGNKLLPMRGYGLDVMSMGFMIDEATPVVWRGPMIVQALSQMLRDVAWNDLDVLVVDMPPGTGDVQLTLSQQVPLDGAIIVSTPQDLALLDARKGLEMFKKTNVPLLGIIENMSYFLCPKCGERSEIFGHGGAAVEAKKLGIPFLGGVPLHMDIRARSDAGQPITATDPGSPHAAIYRELAEKAWAAISTSTAGSEKKPKLDVSASGDALSVSFPGGPSYTLSAEMLRVMSPSAEVQGHSPDQRVTVAKKKNVKVKALEAVGNYAVKIVFDDGHSTGLYSWAYLDELGRDKDARWAAYLAELAQKKLTRE